MPFPLIQADGSADDYVKPSALATMELVHRDRQPPLPVDALDRDPPDL